MQSAVPRVSPLTVALVGGGSVDAGGKGVTVVETQSALLYVRAGGVGPDRILVFGFHVLQLQLHFQGSRRGRSLGLGAGRAGRGDVRYTNICPSVRSATVLWLCRYSEVCKVSKRYTIHIQ